MCDVMNEANLMTRTNTSRNRNTITDTHVFFAYTTYRPRLDSGQIFFRSESRSGDYLWLFFHEQYRRFGKLECYRIG